MSRLRPSTVVARLQLLVATADTRPEQHLLVGAAVLAQRPFAIRAAVDVVERHARQPPPRQDPQIFDVDRMRAGDRLSHREGFYSERRDSALNESY